jgi:proteasome lid subunit RPN8/RPN11
LPDEPVLRFSPVAWAKLEYFCHRGDCEVGGFAISNPNDLLAIEDFATLKQRTTAVSVVFDDAAVGDYFEAQVDAGRTPEQFARIWLHTHPGNCPQPSMTDELTFDRVFGNASWAVMFILARGGQCYCRLRFNAGPGGSMVTPVEIDYAMPFAGSDHNAWRAEFGRNIRVEPSIVRGAASGSRGIEDSPEAFSAYDDMFEPLLDADLFDFDLDECEVL